MDRKESFLRGYSHETKKHSILKLNYIVTYLLTGRWLTRGKMKDKKLTEDIKAYQREWARKNKKKYKEYHREYHKKWRIEHDKKIKAELKKIKEEMNFKNMHNDVLKEIEKDVFVNVANNNKGSLFQNGLGQWYYQIEYGCDRETYISEFFDRKDKAMKDLRVAI